MTTPAFPIPSSNPSAPHPSYGAKKTSRPNVQTVQFGDGYTKRLVFGENQDAKVWNLNWSNISETDADAIESFLEARKGQEAFTWTPPSGSSSKWICPNWSKSIPYLSRATIQATFSEVFEP
tara:strand:- start:110 stop:475 length:366 start_codon:yes stop_codon:yes gene_type:complete